MTGFNIYQIIITVSLTVIIGIIAFWLNRFIKSVDTLSLTVSHLQIFVEGSTLVDVEKHKVINARFKDLEEEIKDLKADIKFIRDEIAGHQTRITVIEKQK